MRILFTYLLIHFFLYQNVKAQTLTYNKYLVDTLTSTKFWGRGYTNNGMQLAAEFLAAEFKKNGLAPLEGKSYLQKFSYSANSFPSKMEVILDGKKLIPGVDYLVTAESKGCNAVANLITKDSVTFIDAENKIIVTLENKLTWSASQEVAPYTLIQLDKNKYKQKPTSLKINVENKYISNFKTANVCAMVKGKDKPDSFLFITAHYDHLGGMGKDTYFPGANDNASGVALLMSLAKYYVANPQKYSIGFILFAGEEIGLLGSKYFTENPLVPLQKIRFLTNTDLAGTGEEGITVVNATLFPKEFALMQNINTKGKYLTAINARGEAANSDHYWFTKKGVPAFFFYTLGGIKAYHDVFDKAATLPLNEQLDLTQLLIKYNAALQGVAYQNL
jgi:aminopeptidase YwaD